MNATAKNQEKTSESKIIPFIKKHWKIITALVVIIGILLYYNFELYQSKKEFKQEKETLITNYTKQLDSLSLAKTTGMVKVFSWSVRSELLRENLEQVDLLLNTFVKENGITKISLINVENNIVQLSTDKKTENEPFNDISLLQINELTVIDNKIFVPISGLNKLLGILIVEFN